MNIEPAKIEEYSEILQYDRHIPPAQLKRCIRDGQVYVLKDRNTVIGVLRYSLFWQTLPFLDLLFIDEVHRRQGCGTAMMDRWEQEMKQAGFHHLMTSTQADETAWNFYEKRGYQKAGGFFPPEQEAEEWIYIKK